MSRTYKASFFSGIRQIGYDVTLTNWSESGADVDLTLGVSPFVVDWPEVETYTPLLTSGCTIKFIANGILTGLMADSYDQIHVQLKDYTNNIVVWSGYLTPNVYSQQYDHDREELELTGIDEISALQYISYNKFIADRRAPANVRSFFNIIRLILLQYCPDISEIWLTDAVRHSSSGDCALLDLYVNEQLFIDEELSCKEAIEAMLQYINATGFTQYGIFEVIDRDKTSGLTLKKYNIGSGQLTETVNDVSYEVSTFDDYYSNTVSTKPIYKDISYVAKFGEFPTWINYKKPTTLDVYDIIGLITDRTTLPAGQRNKHYELNSWPSAVNDKEYVTRARLASCPDNVVLYAYPSNDINTPVDPYPTFDDYYDIIQKAAIPGTNDYDEDHPAAYSMLATYVNLEDTRDKDSFNNTGVSNNDYIALFVNNIYNRSWVTQFTPKKLAEIKYNSKLISINRGYLDISGAVRFENLARRIPNTDHNAKIEGYSNKTTELLMIHMSVKIGNYYYNPGGVQEWTSNETSLVVPLTANKGEEYFADHTIAKTFANIDIDNDGFLVDLSNLPEIYGDITVGFYTYIQNDNTQTSGKAKYDEISTIFIKDLDIKYINYPLVTGDVEYYNSIDNIYDMSYEDENILSTFVDNSNITAQKVACQHPPCNNIVLNKVGGHNVPCSGLFYNMTGNAYSTPIVPEDYKVDRLFNQYSTHTLKFDLAHTNDYDMDVTLSFNDSTSGYKYSILGAHIDYYYNQTQYILVQKK